MVYIPVLRYPFISQGTGNGARRLHGRGESDSNAKFGILVVGFVIGLVVLFIWIYIKHWSKGHRYCRRPDPLCTKGGSKGKKKSKAKGKCKCKSKSKRGSNSADDREGKAISQPDAPQRPGTVLKVINGHTANPELVPEKIDNIVEMPRATYSRWQPRSTTSDAPREAAV